MAAFASPEIGPGAFAAASPAPSGAIPVALAGSLRGAAASRLAALVPASIVRTCRPFESGRSARWRRSAARFDGDLVVYTALADGVTLDEAFATVTAAMPQDDRAASCAEGPFDGPYPPGGAPRGQVACWEPPGGGLVLFWTDDANLVLGGILAESDDHAELDAAWQAAQPP